MDRLHDEPRHRAAVDAWLERSMVPGATVEIVGLFHAAYEALWNRAVTTLGAVTLTAIAERVLDTATERYAFLSAIDPRPNGNERWKEQLHERLSAVPESELIAGLRFGLIELLRIIGALTAEILSQELHAALMQVTTTSPEPTTSADSHALPNVIGPKVLP